MVVGPARPSRSSVAFLLRKDFSFTLRRVKFECDSGEILVRSYRGCEILAAVWYGTAWYGMGMAWAWYGTAWYGMGRHGMGRHGMGMGMVWDGMVWYGYVHVHGLR